MGSSIKTRIANKHDTEANWNSNSAFIPLAGEIIVYDTDSNYDYERFKVGDGTTTIVNLPFMNDILDIDEVDEICGDTIYLSSEVKF